MAKVHAKRNGQLLTVYLDGGNGTVPLSSYDDEPGGFAVAGPMQNILGQLAQVGINSPEFVYHDAPKAAQPVARATAAELAEVNRALGDEAPKAKQAAATTSNPSPAIPQTQLLANVETELSLLFARYSEATGKRKAQLTVELEAICNFLIAVSPEAEGMITNLKQRFARRTFKLEA